MFLQVFRWEPHHDRSHGPIRGRPVISQAGSCYPAWLRLRAAGRLPSSFRLVGSGRDDWGEEEFRNHAETQLTEHAADVAADDRNWLLATLAYQRVDFMTPRLSGGPCRQHWVVTRSLWWRTWRCLAPSSRLRYALFRK
jgi:hypothetical protein